MYLDPMEKVAELLFIAPPLMGHLGQALEIAKVMLDRDHRLSITFLVMKPPPELDVIGSKVIDSLIAAVAADDKHPITFLHLPPPPPTITSHWDFSHRGTFLDQLIEYQERHHVRDTVAQLLARSSPGVVLAGFVVDMLCTAMINVANDLGVPSYVFFTSNAAFLGVMLHYQTLQDDHHKDVSTDLKKCRAAATDELVIPCFAKPVPPRVLPYLLLDKQTWTSRFLQLARGYKRAKGIIVNTFDELESHALNSFSTSASENENRSSNSYYGKARLPQIYPIGPTLNRLVRRPSSEGDEDDNTSIMRWLDGQPSSSVVFLCFGSMGSFDEEQVREIAHGLERSGCRFVWSLRRPRPKDNKVDYPSDYVNYAEVLPEGFLDRTTEIGRVVGWAPQLAVLSHGAVGGFVSHCGWNSILESVWCGVPIATWPIHAEQQLNAFQMVRELGLGVEIRLDYSEREEGGPTKVMAEEIEKAIRRVMDSHCQVRRKMKEMGEKGRTSIKEGGSSYNSLGNLIQSFMDNLPTPHVP